MGWTPWKVLACSLIHPGVVRVVSFTNRWFAVQRITWRALFGGDKLLPEGISHFQVRTSKLAVWICIGSQSLPFTGYKGQESEEFNFVDVIPLFQAETINLQEMVESFLIMRTSK